ncbi:MAG: DedA family protein [Deltaproteobacteria bacterium]|nr:DedA family protein [Deltaproteobacteria bacterium]
MFLELIQIWFTWLNDWGYAGIFILMAMESSVIPVPSELVIPPAAFWASQGTMSFFGVILSGTLGSYAGSLISYWLANTIGHPLLVKYGKFVLISKKKLALAEEWVREYGVTGIFIARLLPVIRHLISMPAGLFQMPLIPFSIATLAGSGIWCLVLGWFGQQTLGSEPRLLESPEIMIAAIESQMGWFVSFAVLLAALYGVIIWFKSCKSE